MTLPKTLEEKEQNQLMIEYKLHNDQQAREKLVLCNIRLAIKITNRICFKNSNIEDCYSVALIALMKAIDNFDIEYLNNNKISTYITKCVTQNLYRYLDKTVRKENQSNCVSLNTPVMTEKDGEEIFLEDLLADENYNEEYLYDLIEKRDVLKKINNFLLNHCTTRTQKLFAYKFGLGGYPVLKEKEIAEKLNYSRGHIAMIYARVLKHIKNYLINGKIPKNKV